MVLKVIFRVFLNILNLLNNDIVQNQNKCRNCQLLFRLAVSARLALLTYESISNHPRKTLINLTNY